MGGLQFMRDGGDEGSLGDIEFVELGDITQHDDHAAFREFALVVVHAHGQVFHLEITLFVVGINLKRRVFLLLRVRRLVSVHPYQQSPKQVIAQGDFLCGLA